MELKIELPDAASRDLVGEALRKTILAGAVQHVMDKLTPDVMHTFVMDLLGSGLKDVVTGYKFRELLEKQAQPIFEQILSRPETQAAIRAAVEAGTASAIEQLPLRIEKQVLARMENLLGQAGR